MTPIISAPLVGMTPDDWFTEWDDTPTTPMCRLCREAEADRALGYHDGLYCEECMFLIIDSQGDGCTCPVWTPRDRWLSRCRIQDGIDRGDSPHEWNAVWVCTEGII